MLNVQVSNGYFIASFSENVKHHKYLANCNRAISIEFLTHTVVQEYPMLRGKRFGELWPTFE